MKFLGDKWWYTKEEGKEMILAIFPNWPDTSVVRPVPYNMYPPDSPHCKFPKENNP